MTTISTGRRTASRGVAALCAAGAAVLLAACGDESSTTAAPVTVTQTRTTTVAATPETTADPAPSTTARAATPSAASDDRGCIRVPDVVGRDHQEAQDTMQAAGLYDLDEEDATGQGRLLIIDRNWVVVSQRPSAGRCVSEDTAVLLRSKKDGE